MATDGPTGGAGSSSIVASVYQRAGSPPSTPTADDGSYDFTNQVLVPPSGWSTEPPTVNGLPLYVSLGIFEIVGTTGTDNTVVWSSVTELVTDGESGDDGSASLVAGRQANSFLPWFGDNLQATNLTTPWTIEQPSGTPVWPDVLRITDNDDAFEGAYSNRTSCDITTRYRAQLQAKRTSGDRDTNFVVVFYDNVGDRVDSASSPVSDATGWTAITGNHEWTADIDLTTSWVNHSFEFGGTAAPTIPTGAVAMAVGGAFSGTGGSSSTVIEFQDYALFEMPPSSIPGFSYAAFYDNLDTNAGLSTTQGAWCMLTDRDDADTGDQNDFKDTDGISLALEDLDELYHNVFFGKMLVDDRVTLYIDGGRWYHYKVVDVAVAVYGEGDRVMHTFGVTLISFNEDSNSDITLTTGFPVEFQFSRPKVDTARVSPGPVTASDIEFGGSPDPIVGYSVDSDGATKVKFKAIPGLYFATGVPWLILGSNADYEVLLTKISGDDPTAGPALDTWLATTADRSWDMEDTTAGMSILFRKEGVFEIQFRDKVSLLALDTASVHLIADLRD